VVYNETKHGWRGVHVIAVLLMFQKRASLHERSARKLDFENKEVEGTQAARKREHAVCSARYMRDCEYRSQEHFNYSGVMKNASGKNRA
jgi:hypothetical protein